ncbi:MAG: DUF1192 domain-containing protein [Rhodomicrobiaceae bacterium]
MWDEEKPKKAPAYVIGADLSTRSVEELRDYLEILEAERERTEAMLNSKQASREAADTFFKG